MKLLNSLILVLPVPSALAATYNLVDNILGTAFLTTFNFEAISDPTHGRVSVPNIYRIPDDKTDSEVALSGITLMPVRRRS